MRQLKELQNPQTEAQLFITGTDVLIVNSSSDELISILRKPGLGCLAFVVDIEEACKEFTEEPKRPRTARKHPRLFPDVQGYTAKQVTKITGVSSQTLHLWAKSKVIQPSIAPATGRGSERVYSHQDLVALRVAAELRRKGISTSSMKEVIKSLRQLREFENSQTKPQLVIFGRDGLAPSFATNG